MNLGKRVSCMAMAAAVIAGLSLADTARADLAYRWVFDADSYVVAPGEKFAVKVYLEEAGGASDVGILNPDSGVGMFGLGVGVFFGDAPQPTDRAAVLATSDILANLVFNDTAGHKRELFADYASLIEVSTAENPIYGELVSGNTYRLLAGTFMFTAGDVPGETTLIRAADNSSHDSSISLGFDILDQSIGEGRAMITTVPEPSSLVLMGIVAVCLGGWQVRRRRM